jgi:hypothetical protein
MDSSIGVVPEYHNKNRAPRQNARESLMAQAIPKKSSPR